LVALVAFRSGNLDFEEFRLALQQLNITEDQWLDPQHRLDSEVFFVKIEVA
jgi:hypothetical protein